MIVAIHQPNFFPWLGYFNKIANSHAFCFLDDVQFPKKGGTWTNRVRLTAGGSAAWITAAVDRSYSGTRTILEVKTLSDQPWREKLIKTLRTSYGRAPFFEETMALIAPLIRNPTDNLCQYNLAAVQAITAALQLHHVQLTRASDFGVTGSGTRRLAELVRAAGGTAYLCGGGAEGYQEDAQFDAAGIELIYQDFQHPVYTQGNSADFASGLSVIDVLMHCGIGKTAILVRASRPGQPLRICA